VRRFCAEVHGRHWRGATGEPISDVVNIGIGGSDLGPRMATQALMAFRHPDLRVHYVANLDAADLATTLAALQPRTTLFIIASKTFTTQETMQNAASARAWLVQALGEAAVARHFVAVSTNLAAKSPASASTRPMPSPSGTGLAAAIRCGRRSACRWRWPSASTISKSCWPARMRWTNISSPRRRTKTCPACWRCSKSGTPISSAPTPARLLPYSQSLGLLPRYLQQLEMESNGKPVDRQGQPLDHAVAPILWGEPGTNGQHAFYQLIHQGGRLIPCEFIACRQPDFDLTGHHARLLANCFAQGEALMRGRTVAETTAELLAGGMAADEAARITPFRSFPGNQPSTTLLLPRLDPHNLGALIALYEHKVFAESVIWDINSFDQWGVEYGKQLASRLLPIIEGRAAATGLDSSTTGLIAWSHAAAKRS
jgi:glucose-6-phosphate isomerase